MILILTFSLLSWADGGPGAQLPSRPEPPKAIEGECKKVLPINRGQPLPDPFRISLKSAPCSGVVVPLSDYADLLATEKWAEAIAQQYVIDIRVLESDRDWYKSKLEEESQPLGFFDRPSTQRWFGRVETLVTVGIVAVGLSAAYQYGSGGLK